MAVPDWNFVNGIQKRNMINAHRNVKRLPRCARSDWKNLPCGQRGNEMHALKLRLRPLFGQCIRNSRYKLFVREWLGQSALGAKAGSKRQWMHGAKLASARHRHNLCLRRPAADIHQGFQAIFFGHPDIQEHHVDPLRTAEPHRLFSGPDHISHESSLAKHRLKDRSRLFIIINDQDCLHIADCKKALTWPSSTSAELLIGYRSKSPIP